MSSCLLNFKDAASNTKQFLVSQGGLKSMQSNIIADLGIFQATNKKLEQQSIQAYGVPGYPWLQEKDGNHAFPNWSVLNKIDKVRKQLGLYEEQLSGKITTPVQDKEELQLATEHNLPSELNPELKEKLMGFAEKLGIKIQTLEDLVERRGANGIADITNFLILLQNGQEGALPEEIAHFFVELLPEDHPLFKQMDDIAPSTRLYKEVYAEYKKVYGNDIPRLKREVMAKLIAMYLVDPTLASHWAGSENFWDRVLQWIKEFLGFVKRDNRLLSFKESAESILNLDTSQLILERARLATEMFNLSSKMNPKFETLDKDGKDLGRYDKVFVNLNDTIFDYQNYDVLDKEEKRKMLFKDSPEREAYYENVGLTPLGMEMMEKIDFIRDKLVFHTNLAITPALEARLQKDFGITRDQLIKVESSEEVSPMKIGTTYPLQEKIKELKDQNPNIRIVTIDNKPLGDKIQSVSDFIQYVSNRSSYTPYAEKLLNWMRGQDQTKFNQEIIKELEGLNKFKLLKEVTHAVDMVLRNEDSIKKTGDVLTSMKEDELNEVFEGESKIVNLPTGLAQRIGRIVNEKKMEKDMTQLLDFVAMIQGTTSFFTNMNQTNYSALRKILDNPNSTDEEIDAALYQLNALNRMISGWNEYITQFNTLLQGQNTKHISEVLGELRTQLDKSKANIMSMSRGVITRKIFPMFEGYNSNKDVLIAEMNTLKERPKIAGNQKLLDRIDEQIATIEDSKQTPDTITKALLGESQDIDAITVWAKTLHNSGDPLIGGLATFLKRVEMEADVKNIKRSQEFNEDIRAYMQKNGLSQKDIEELIVMESSWNFNFDKNDWEEVKSWAFINPYKDRHLYEQKVREKKAAQKAWYEAKDNIDPEVVAEALKTWRKAKADFDTWEKANWHKVYTDAYYERYASLLQTEEDKLTFEKIKEIQSEIWTEVNRHKTQLEHTFDVKDARVLNAQILDLMRDLKALRNPFNKDGSPKDKEGTDIAIMLGKKNKIDYGDKDTQGVYYFEMNSKKFMRDLAEIINTTPMNKDVQQTLIGMIEKAEPIEGGHNFADVVNYAKRKAPLSVNRWIEENTVQKYSQEFYDTRQAVTDRLAEVFAELREVKGLPAIPEDNMINELWRKLFSITSELRDQNGVFDGTLSSPETQQLVVDIEMEIERLKREANDDTEDGLYGLTGTAEEKKRLVSLKKELKKLLQELSDLQSKEFTDSYNDHFDELIKLGYPNDAFIDILQARGIVATSSMDIDWLNNNPEFHGLLEEFEDHPFAKWHKRNHIIQIKKDSEGNEQEKILPSYIWRKITPNKAAHIQALPGQAYSDRKVREIIDKGLLTEQRLVTEKIDWVTWNPVTNRFLPKSEKFFNPEYTKIKANPVKFGLLKILTEFHLDTQMQSSVPRDAKLEFKIPYKRKEGIEGNIDEKKAMWKNLQRQFTDKDNRFEEGEDNFGEAGTDATPVQKKKRGIASYMNGWDDPEIRAKRWKSLTKPGSNLIQASHSIAVPYVHYVKPEFVTKDVIYSLTIFAGTTSRSAEMVKATPMFRLTESLLKDPSKFVDRANETEEQARLRREQGIDDKRVEAPNRVLAVEWMLANKFHGFNKQFEFGRGVDDTILKIQKANSFGSLSDFTGWANNIKNNIQGRLNNVINTEFADWSDWKSMMKASVYPQANLVYFLTQSELPADKRSKDYNIIAWMNPGFERASTAYLGKGAKKRFANQNFAGYSSNMSEYGLGTTSLYAHLFHVKVKDANNNVKSLYDVIKKSPSGLEVEDGWVNARTGKPIDQAYLLRTKMTFISVQEYIQGKMQDKTLINSYTAGSALLYFKNWLIPMLRRRFDPQMRANYVLNEDVQGYWIQGIKIVFQLLRDLIKDGVLYWPTLTPQEKSAVLAMAREVGIMLATSLAISMIWGFDADDEDKYAKLKDNSYLQNLTLLIALQAKAETESLSLSPFGTIEDRIAPPIFTEATKYIKNPFVWLGVLEDLWKMVNVIEIGGEQPVYERDMPAYNIQKGDMKLLHYAKKVTQWNDLVYTSGDPFTDEGPNPEGKIQVFINNLKR